MTRPNATLINRELSQLAFNRRVLALARSASVPLLERLRFLCIASSNLDEFFEIRVAGLKEQLRVKVAPPGMTLQGLRALLAAIGDDTRLLIAERYRLLNEQIVPALAAAGIRLLRHADRTRPQRAWVTEYFRREVKPLLTPIGLDPAHPFPQVRLKRLWLAPFTMHRQLLEAIHRETRHAKAGKAARIIGKMNAVLEEAVIKALYAASQAGVKIDLVVRGACALRPGVKGLSENIRVRSIVGRFLEHSRVWHFENDGNKDVYLSSADWMGRNLFRRIEIAFPVLDQELKARVIAEGLKPYIADNREAWELTAEGSYQRSKAKGRSPPLSAQQELLDRLADQPEPNS